MKEYVAKEDLDKTRQNFISTVYYHLSNERDNFKANCIIDAYDLSINNLYTVTKADICREFVIQCKKRYEYVIKRNDRLDIGGYISIDSIVDDVLAEMER